MKKIILFSAPIKTRSGYGDHARDLAYSILLKGNTDYELQILATSWGNTPWTGLDTSTEKGKAIANCIVDIPPPIPPDIFMQLTIPNEFQPVGKFNIGITAGIETDLCAPDWIEGINRMDMLITTSNHSLNVFKESKYEVRDTATKGFVKTLQMETQLRHEVLFEGLDLNIYKKTKPGTTSKLYKQIASIKEDFGFLFVGHWLSGDLGQDRKDVGMLIATFAKAFSNKPPSTRPCLILKTSHGSSSIPDKYYIESRVKEILSPIKNSPSVYLIHGDLTEEEMNILYNHSKVKAMVSFTKGEGFGRPLLEFGITGKPIIAPNWSGHLDFLPAENCILLPGKLTDVHKSTVNEWILKDAKWFTVDYEYASNVLQSVYTYYSQFSKTCSAQSSYVEKNFSFDIMAQKFIDLLNSINISIPVSITIPKKQESPQPFSLQLPKLKKIE